MRLSWRNNVPMERAIVTMQRNKAPLQENIVMFRCNLSRMKHRVTPMESVKGCAARMRRPPRRIGPSACANDFAGRQDNQRPMPAACSASRAIPSQSSCSISSAGAIHEPPTQAALARAR